MKRQPKAEPEPQVPPDVASFRKGNLQPLFLALFGGLSRSMVTRPPGVQPTPMDPITVPRWALEAAINAVVFWAKTRSRGKGAHARWWSRHRDDMIDLNRYRDVEVFRQEPYCYAVSAACNAAAEQSGLRGQAETYRKAYIRVRRRMAEDPSRYALLLSVPR